ncbi:MAG: S9 family peptidase [Acidobacteria bacterium]|nr:MAG: S9 family peptidase [Acidobacteriota bacterium]REK03606.1 MAG: S9 family peptidase [Acidobacteriota bacterium]
MSDAPRVRTRLHRLPLPLTAVVLLAGLFVAGCSGSGDGAVDASAQPREVSRYDAETFFDTETVRGASFSADGSRILLSSDRSGTFEAYAQPVAGGEPEQLTSTEGATFGVSYFPADDRFLYTADQGGNELNHLYVQTPEGEVRDLTPGEAVKASFNGWSADDQSFFVSTNERDPQVFDLYRYDVEDYERTLIWQNPGGLFLSDVSRDGRWVAAEKAISNANSDLYLVDLEGNGELRHITPHEGDVMHGVFGFTPDSTALIYASDEGTEFRQARRHDLTTGEQTTLVAADWDVLGVAFSEGGRYRAVALNEDARTAVTLTDLAEDREIDIPLPREGDLGGMVISDDEKTLAFYLASDTSPSNLYVWEIGSASAPRRLTSTLSEQVAEEDLVDGEVVRFASYDGLEIPGVLYRPHQASADSPVPVLLAMHGGPGGQSRKGYRAEWQHLVNHGYGIFAVNNRGSSGYGKTFFHLDDRKHGEADLDDCVAAVGYLQGLDWVDGERIGIMGGSYGGYLVAAALAFRPQVFDVGINIFGVTNWVRTMESIPPWWGPQRDALIAEIGDPVADAERLRAISPVFHGDKIVKPLLVVQGANDPRVLPRESEDLVAAARANGTPVEYVVFEDEGHGFRNKDNRIAAQNAYLDFLAEHLREPAADDAAAAGSPGGGR